jgi:WhiB family redox-sensing transcriptional regulator
VTEPRELALSIEDIASLRRAGVTLMELAKTLRCDRGTIERYLRTAGYTTGGDPVAAPTRHAPYAPPVKPRDPNEHWSTYALCAETDGDEFFPNQGESNAHAKAVCAKCEVKPECLEYALANHPLPGVWGGTSDHERRKMMRQAS